MAPSTPVPLPATPAEEAGRRPSPGARLRLEVSALALEGDALGRLGSYVLFVPGAIPGEEVDVEVESAGRKHGRARLLRVLRPSPHRVAPPCPYFGPCGGCSWQHIAYPEQLRQKERLLRSVLELALGVSVPVAPVVGLEPWGFRNKAHFVVGRDHEGRPALGHYRAHSRDFLPVEECRVHHPRANEVAFRLRDLLREHGVPPVERERLESGTARHVVVRASERTAEVQAVLVATRRKFPGLSEVARAITTGPARATGFHLNTNRRPGTLVLGSYTRRLEGHPRLLEEVAGVRFSVSPISFFQTSVKAAEKLVELVIEAVERPMDTRDPERGEYGRGDERPHRLTVLDLYAGVGLFALPLARRGHRVLAVEENPHAVEDGIETAERNRIPGVRFARGRVEKTVRRLAERGRSFGAVVLDPPREGCPPRVLWGAASGLRPPCLVYVSCDPRALARDLKTLLRAGYAIEEVRPVDMFPHTPHIEVVAVLRLPRRRGGPPRRFRREGRGAPTPPPAGSAPPPGGRAPRRARREPSGPPRSTPPPYRKRRRFPRGGPRA